MSTTKKKQTIAPNAGYLSVADIKHKNAMRYLFFHEDYVTLNINQKITDKAFYIKHSI